MSLPRYPTLTILAFAGLMLLTDVVPALHNYKVMDWNTVPAVLSFVDRKPSATPEMEEQQRLRPDMARQAKYPLDDAEHDLDRFYEALHRAEGKGKGAEARILHYGDSPTTADLITSDARALLQKQFGDAGHGFCLIAKPWAWYAHRGADVDGHGWTVDPVNQSSIKDGLFGLGGVSFRGGPGAIGRVKLSGPHTRMEVAFLKQPGGGQLRVFAGEQDLGVVDTEGTKAQSGFASFALPSEARQISVQAMSGPVRLFGMMFSKESPGVVYHSLGVNGAYVSVLAKFFNESHWREQLQHYRPHLVIVNYGTNESVYPQFVDYASEKELREIVRRLRAAVPEASILIMSPMDRGQRMATGEIGTVPAIPRLVAIQRRVAADLHCAFFNTFEAMGGMGTMGRWYAAEPRLVGADFIHPMPGGAKIVGGLLYQALLEGYNKYKLRLIQKKTMVAGK
ncbi:MAG: GDSL-type esterase/lipase family protein [Bryobacteraceae bacterium]